MCSRLSHRTWLQVRKGVFTCKPSKLITSSLLPAVTLLICILFLMKPCSVWQPLDKCQKVTGTCQTHEKMRKMKKQPAKLRNCFLVNDEWRGISSWKCRIVAHLVESVWNWRIWVLKQDLAARTIFRTCSAVSAVLVMIVRKCAPSLSYWFALIDCVDFNQCLDLVWVSSSMK